MSIESIRRHRAAMFTRTGLKVTVLVITTSRLSLVLRTPAEILAWVETLPPEVQREVSPDWIARIRATTSPDPFGLGFGINLKDSTTSVGSCGFKGPPDADGMVEIAYGIDPEYQSQGFATESTRALLDLAFSDPRVKFVRAHTRHDNAASIGVLKRAGFKLHGDVIDPEDGLVMRWETFPAS